MNLSHHETSDIYLAAYLLSQGATFVICRRVGLRRNIFSFVADESFHELLRLYWRQQPMSLVPAQLFDSLRRLKSISRLRPEPASDAGAEPGAAPTSAGADAGSDGPEAFPKMPC